MSAGHADELLALTAFLTRESRGVLIAASIESPARAFRSGTRVLQSAPRADEPRLQPLPRRELGKAAALGDDQPGPSQRLSRLSPRVADRGFAPAPHARLPVRNPRGDAALRRAGIPRPRVISRLARAGASDRDARRAALKQ